MTSSPDVRRPVAPGSARVPAAIARARRLVEPALRAAVAAIPDERMRRIAGYQLGWWDAEGTELAGGGGKAVRPTLTLLAAEAAGRPAEVAVPAAVAVELVHNFSLLHDDIMDRDVERRHRPTGWVAFGEGQAILAGSAMLTAAVDAVVRGTEPGTGAAQLALLLDTVQLLISGQSADLDLEERADAELADVLEMERGKTAALIACATGIGALAADAAPATVEALSEAGWLLGLAFQLVDDVLGVIGDPAVTGKSASSDIRAGKRSVPVVAALRAGTAQSAELAELLADGAPQSELDVARAARLVQDAGGVEWAEARARLLLAEAVAILDGGGLADPVAVGELREMAHFLVGRDW